MPNQRLHANPRTIEGNIVLTPVRKRALATTLTIVAWLFFLILAIRVFNQDSIYVLFDSDGAIPVLMANDDRPVTIFDTYYWGVDRWGAWPLILGKVVHQATGFQWTDHRLHVVRTTWVFLGLLVLVLMNRRAALAVLVSGLIALCLEPTTRWQLFSLSQVYAWQLTALFLAWFCLRRLLAAKLVSATGKQVLIRRTLWCLSFYFSAFLAIWSSEASAPFLVFLLLLEGLRSYFLYGGKAVNKWKRARYVTALLILAAATLSPLLMKANYHRHGWKHYGGDFKAPVWVDLGYLSENLQANWRHLTEFTFFPLIIVSCAFLLGMALVLAYPMLTGKRALRGRLMLFAQDDTVTMIAALVGIALINFVMMIFLSHVRLSLYNNRYLNPTFFLGSISGLMTIYLLLRLFANRLRLTRYAIPITILGAFVLLIAEFPRVKPSDRYKVDKDTALILAQKAPGAFVMGGYWETYIFASLQSTNRMTPLPLEGLQVRIPWTPEMLRDAKDVVIEYRHNDVMNRGTLPEELWQYGKLLKLKDPQFYQNSSYSFALYLNEHK